MKRHFTAILCALGVLAATAEARPVPVSKLYETDKKQGVGLMLGTPFAIAGKYHATDELAFSGGVGANLFRKRAGFHMHADVVWHPFVFIEGTNFLAPLYAGGGLRFLVHDGISRLGLRLPVGIEFDFEDKPVSAFVEMAFVLDLSVSEGGRGTVDGSAVMGARYWF